MTTPLVSVAVITYNQEKTIKQTIESILNQVCSFDFEIIIGDDFSTDNTLYIIKEYERIYPKKIKIVENNKHIGLVENYYKTIFSCSGKYITQCAGDDYWTDIYKIQKQVDFLEKNPDYGLVHSDVNHYYEDKNKFIYAYNKTKNIHIPEGFIFEEILKPSHIIKAMTVCIRKDIVINHYFENKINNKDWLLEDLPLWLETAAHYKIYYFDEVSATYRISKKSISKSPDYYNRYKFHKSVFNVRFYFVNKYGCSDYILKQIKIEYYRTLIKDSFYLNNSKLAKFAFKNLLIIKKNLSIKEILFFIGAKSKLFKKIILCLFSFVMSLKNIFSINEYK